MNALNGHQIEDFYMIYRKLLLALQKTIQGAA
jgi:hypothetical protein